MCSMPHVIRWMRIVFKRTSEDRENNISDSFFFNPFGLKGIKPTKYCDKLINYDDLAEAIWFVNSLHRTFAFL